ncbi:hypothetical protein ABIC16_003004 [Sphingomonas sp. PvP055]|uniref:hypothetical protein n=1 Tax=Sphingomonas sp. PvP055 TaxID=3156391 RepID=UPI003397534B
MNAFPILAALSLAAAQQAAPKEAPPPAPVLPSVDGLPIGSIPRQELPRKGCAAYLWTASGTRALVAMATGGGGTDPARLRLSIGGKVTDLDRTGQLGAISLGFPETTTYAGAGTTIKLTMRAETRTSITDGGAVPDGILELDRTGQDSVIIPVAGLIGCT